MHYTYQYPDRIKDINRRRYGRITIPEGHLAQTHEELLQILDIPGKTYTLRFDLAASREVVWEESAGSIARFFGHHHALMGVTELNGLGSGEGGRHIIHRELGGHILDRMSEVLISLPLAHLTVSDVDITDPSVSGYFPTLHTIRLESPATDPALTHVFLSSTFLGVPHPMVFELLQHQSASITSAIDGRAG